MEELSARSQCAVGNPRAVKHLHGCSEQFRVLERLDDCTVVDGV
jgi:hypothetical protein